MYQWENIILDQYISSRLPYNSNKYNFNILNQRFSTGLGWPGYLVDLNLVDVEKQHFIYIKKLKKKMISKIKKHKDIVIMYKLMRYLWLFYTQKFVYSWFDIGNT